MNMITNNPISTNWYLSVR